MLLTTTLLVFSAALPAMAAGGPPADPAGEFRVPACSTTPAAAWTVFSDPWLKGRAPKGWVVSDSLARWEPAASTSAYRRLVVDVDASLKASPKPALSLFGMLVPGKPPAPGGWLDETLAHARVRGDYVLGRAGTVDVPGRGACALAVIEHNARRACSGGPDVVCRRAALHLDCGVRDGLELLVTAKTPGYPVRGAPDGKAAAALADIKKFLCALEAR
ncbi:MAG: hypothetical protein FD126_322 [Elusimicrobia bacterium]|nr:MAG: hypothetical protein FD126_322 [Elusimicrobiota bacterium]